MLQQVVILLVIHGAWAALAPPYPVLRIAFEVNELNKSALVAQLLATEWYVDDLPGLKADELLKCTNLADLEWPELMATFVADGGTLDLQKCREVARVLDVHARSEWNNFFNETNRTESMLEVVDMLKLPKLEFMHFLLNKDADNAVFFDLLTKANVSIANLEHVSKLKQISRDSFIGFVRRLFLNHMPNVLMTNFTRLLDTLASDGVLISTMFQYPLQVRSEGALADMVVEYNRSLPYLPLLATRVFQGHYVSSESAYKQILYMIRQFTRPLLLEANASKIEIVRMTLNGSLLLLETRDHVGFTAPRHNVSQLESCLYTISDSETIVVSPSQRPTAFIALKVPQMPFVNGAPLFCDDQLVGVANEQTFNTIGFAKTPFNLSLALTKETQRDLEFLMYVTFTLVQNRIPQLVAYLAVDASWPLGSLQPGDFLKAFKFASINYEQLKMILNRKNNATGRIYFIEVLQSVNVSLVDTFNTLRALATQEQEAQILRLLNIDQVQLYNHLVSSNEAALGAFLKKANWTLVNIEKVLDLGDERAAMFDVIKRTYLSHVAMQPLPGLLQILRDNGGFPMLKRLISILNVQRNDMRITSIEQIVNGFDEHVNAVEIFASAVTRSHLITVSEIYDHWSDNATRYFTQLQVENHGFPPINVSDIAAYSTGYANLTLTSPLPSVIDTIPIGNGTMPKNCSVLSDLGSSPVRSITRTTQGFQVTMAEGREKMNLGAALVCEGSLYGVATKVHLNQTQFSGFKNARLIHKPTDGAHSSGAKPIVYQALLVVVCCSLMTSFQII